MGDPFHLISNEVRREIVKMVLQTLGKIDIKGVMGEHSKIHFWNSRARVSDLVIRKLYEIVDNETKLKILEIIEKDLKEALELIEREKLKISK
jgi:hypothetical protein